LAEGRDSFSPEAASHLAGEPVAEKGGTLRAPQNFGDRNVAARVPGMGVN
jgi:hypothetical protein